MRILIVDDVPDNAELLSRFLRRRGFECHIAENGEVGVYMTESLMPDLVFMDISMPVMDGLTATRMIRNTPEIAHTPVVALTAHAMAKDREECLQAGCDDFAVKPIEFGEILNIANSYNPELTAQRRSAS